MKYAEPTIKGLSESQIKSFEVIAREMKQKGHSPEEGIELMLSFVTMTMTTLGINKLEFASEGILIIAHPQSELGDAGVLEQPATERQY